MADEPTVAPSVDTPSEQTETVTPTEPTETVTPTEPSLYKLPDGREVDAETLTKEWKENFLPDYTQKSQKLAEIEKSKITNDPPQSKYAQPDYVPQTYEELIQEAEQRAVQRIHKERQDEIERQTALENEVANQLSEVKKLDATVNENELFLHATKYGFRDLRQAYANMRDFRDVVKKVQTNTVQNIQKRNDPVSVSPGATGQRPDPSHFSSAVDYMRSLK